MPCQCDCEVKCYKEENCNGDNCQCKEIENTVDFEPEMNIKVH